MTDKVSHAQQRARDLAAKVEELATAITRRATPRKLEKLEVMRTRLAEAEGDIKHLLAVRARIEARNVGLMRRMDKLAAAAPAVAKQWEADRAKEPKRLKKLKAAIEKRTTKDKTARPDWMKKPVALPPPVEQPSSIEHDPQPSLPHREGLIPGTYTFKDPSRLMPLLDAPPVPKTWTAEHVARRMIDAHATLRCMPERGKPKSYGAMWPAYKNEAGELAIQAGAGTLLLGRNRVRRVPSGDEVALMEEALTWVGQYLSGTNAWARIALISWTESRHPDDDPLDDPEAPVDLLEFIAKALNAEKRVVR